MLTVNSPLRLINSLVPSKGSTNQYSVHCWRSDQGISAASSDNTDTLGVIHAPVLDKTYAAAEGLGASRHQHGLTETIRVALTPAAGEVVRVVGSRSHYSADIEDYLSRFPKHELIAVGSSLKFCLVAEGSAHLYPRFGPTMLWDTGAGHVIAKVAGAHIEYQGIANPAYHRENLKNPNFLVSAL